MRRRYSVILGMGLLLPSDIVLAQASSTVDFKGEWHLVSGDTSAPCPAPYLVGGIKWHKTLVGDESFRGFLWLKTRSGKPRNTRCPAVETPRAHYLEIMLFGMGERGKTSRFRVHFKSILTRQLPAQNWLVTKDKILIGRFPGILDPLRFKRKNP